MWATLIQTLHQIKIVTHINFTKKTTNVALNKYKLEV